MRTDKQTAVEWLLYSLARNNIATISVAESIENEHRIIKQAKEMEREQLIEFYEDGQYSANYPYGLTGEAYYNQEYGSNE